MVGGARFLAVNFAVLLLLGRWGEAAGLEDGSSVIRNTWNLTSFPNPQRDLDACGRRGVPSSVCDPDGIISYRSTNVLEGMINAIQKKEHPFTASIQCSQQEVGYQLAVALMQKMQPGSTVETFAKSLFDQWGVGRADCQNGLLLLVAIDDRKMYVATGSGVPLGRRVIERILDRVKPKMRDGQYDAAFESVVHDLGVSLANEGADFRESPFDFIVSLLVLTVILMSWCFCGSSTRELASSKECKKKLDKITADRDRARNRVYQATTCPICLEDWTEQSKTSVLTCGHKFCEECVISWLRENRDTCPVCRESILMGERPTQSNAVRNPELDRFVPEMRYRLSSLRRRYPTVVTDSTYHSWMASDLYREDFAAEANFVAANAAILRRSEAYASSGRGGTTSSFGGGSSSGGGGGGSSW